jgi:predicted amidohydrolase YtcJ
VARRLPGAGGRQLQPEQALSPAEAVRAATVTAAGSLQAPGGGGLTPGEVADLVVCDGDPFQEGTRATQTWIGGRLVWPAPGQEGSDGPTSTPTSTSAASATPPSRPPRR